MAATESNTNYRSHYELTFFLLVLWHHPDFNVPTNIQRLPLRITDTVLCPTDIRALHATITR